MEVLAVEVGWAGGVGVGWGEEEEGGVGVSFGYGVVRLKRVEAVEYRRCTDWTTAPAPVRFFIAIRINAITLIWICIHIIIRICILHSPLIVDVSSIPIRIPVSIIAIIVSHVPIPVRATAISRPGWRVSGHG